MPSNPWVGRHSRPCPRQIFEVEGDLTLMQRWPGAVSCARKSYPSALVVKVSEPKGYPDSCLPSAAFSAWM